MPTYDVIVLILGLAFLAAALLPRLLKKTIAPAPMMYIGFGMLISLLWADSSYFDPVKQSVPVERLAELAVIISLMSAGLKLDRPLGWRTWQSTWRLLAITMPLCIAGLAITGIGWIGLPLAAAVLLGAVIAPTDPVLASAIQVGPPGEKRETEMRFALTSEAGLNDGLAFPFVNLAIVLAATGLARDGLAQWLAIDLFWKILAGIAVGATTGHLLAILVFRYLKSVTVVSDGFAAIALTLVAYGATELAHGYGFIGVFTAAIMFRRYERDHEYHTTLHSFSEQIEQLFEATILILFGAAIAGGLFNALTWPAVITGLVFLVIIRPATGMLGLVRTRTPLLHRGAIALLGIRGIGTFYYLAHGLNNAHIGEENARILWSTAGFIILASIVLHGTTAPYIVRRIKD